MKHTQTPWKATLDLSKKPLIYRTDNPNHYGRWCIDFFPETVPTLASFPKAQDAVDYLIAQFGKNQVEKWFGGTVALVLPEALQKAGVNA